MSLSERINAIRKEKKISVDELCVRSGVPKGTLSKITAGITTNPTLDTVQAIARALDCRLDDFDDTTPITNNAPSLSNEALQVAIDYSDLDKPGKRAVRVTLDDQRRRVKEEANRNDKVTLFPAKEFIQLASAGYGDFSDDDSFVVVDLIKRPPAGTTYIVRVDGNSMEPTYHDGDRLFVSAQKTLRYGDIGVFSINGDIFVKEYGRNGLMPHNHQYPTIRPEDGDSVCEGSNPSSAATEKPFECLERSVHTAFSYPFEAFLFLNASALLFPSFLTNGFFRRFCAALMHKNCTKRLFFYLDFSR